MTATTASPCPDAAALSRYVHGQLAELAAEQLARHVDHCPHCQRQLDALTHRQDSLIDALRHADAAGPGRDPDDLARLIERAQQSGIDGRPRPAEPIGLDPFVD